MDPLETVRLRPLTLMIARLHGVSRIMQEKNITRFAARRAYDEYVDDKDFALCAYQMYKEEGVHGPFLDWLQSLDVEKIKQIVELILKFVLPLLV